MPYILCYTSKTSIGAKAVLKMIMKSYPVVNLAKNLRAAFLPIKPSNYKLKM